MKRRFLLIFFWLLSVNCHFLFGQQLTFSRVLFDDLLHGCIVHAYTSSYDNGYMIAGETDFQGMIVKIDSEGNYLWAKKYETGTKFNDIIRTSDSAFVLVGSTYDGYPLCVKTNILGDTIWQKKIIGSTPISALTIEQTFDAGFIMTGYKWEITAPYSRVFVAKLDASGDMEWSKYFAGGNNSNLGHSVHQTPDSGYVVSGYMEDFPPTMPGAIVTKLNSTGEITWAKKIYDSSAYPTAFYSSDFMITNDGFIFYLSANDLFGSFLLVRTDSAVNILWSKRYDYLGSGPPFLGETPLKFHRTTDGGYLLVHGSCWGSAMVRVDSLGNLIFAKGVDMATVDLAETKDKGYLIIGNGPMCAVKTNDYMIPQIGIIKTDSFQQAPMCLYDIVNNVPVDYALLDTTLSIVSSSDAVISAYHSVLTSVGMFYNDGCVAHGSDISHQEDDKSVSLFPNPANSLVHLESKSNIEFFQLRTLSGKLLIAQAVNASDFNLDMSRYPSGTYFLTLLQGDQLVHKMIIKQ